ncbi:hypothetical protein BJX70DRAFT_395161 [Aspergillus crustosus]
MLKSLRLNAISLIDWDTDGLSAKNSITDVVPQSLESLTIDHFHECPNTSVLVEQLEDITDPRSPDYLTKLCGLHIRGSFSIEATHQRFYKGVTLDILETKFQAAAALLCMACDMSDVRFTMWCDILDDLGGDGVPEECYEAVSLGGQVDKLHLARCNKHLYEILRPEVFHHVTLSYDCKWELSCLVHALIRNPRAAVTVRSMCLIDKRCSHPEAVKFSHALIRRKLPRIAISDDGVGEWINTLQGKSDEELYFDGREAWRTLLLILAPRLEKLHMEWGWVTDLRETAMKRICYREKPFDTHPALTRLKQVFIPPFETDVGIEVDEVLQMFRLPAMRKFIGHFVMDTDVSDDAAKEPTAEALVGFSSVTDIALYDSNSAKAFSQLIKACKTLESFVYEFGGLLEMDLADIIDHPALYDQLVRHRDTLKTLEVYYVPDTPYCQ